MNTAPSVAERQGILDGLESADEEVRRLCVEQLVRLPIDEAVLRLAECLGDPSWRVRKTAVERLVACRKNENVQEMLVRSLADGENPGRRNAAFDAIVACGTGMTSRLVAEMANPDVDVRKLVVDALAVVGDSGCRAPLRSAIADEDPNIRAAAVEALGVVGGIDEIAHLLSVATRPEEDLLVRLSSLRALSCLEAGVGVASVGEVLEHSLLRSAAFDLLGYSADPQAAETLLKGLSSGSPSNREAAMAALLRTLGQLDGDSASRFVEGLREAAGENSDLVDWSCDRLEMADLASRMVLIQFLGLLDDPRVVVPILEAGRDEAIEELADRTLEASSSCLAGALEARWSELDLDLKRRACTILGRQAGDVAERLLLEALEVGDIQLRCVAAIALGEGGFFGRLPDLVRRLEAAAREDETDAYEEVATIVEAIVQLAEHPEAEATGIDVALIEVLSSRLAGAVEPVRLAIAKVLARLGRPQDEDVMTYLLKDESPAVRRAAVQTLARFDFESSRDALRLALGDEASMVRIAAATVLGHSECLDATRDLARLLADDDPRVVAVAVRSIGHLHRRQAADVHEIENLLAPALDAEAMVALAGLEALMEVGGDAAGRMAATALRRPEPDVLRLAIACLGAHGDAGRLTELLPLMAHSDWSVRAEAVQVLSDRAIRKALPGLLRRLEVEGDVFVRTAILRAVERLED